MRKIEVSEEELRELYIDRDLSTSQIAELLGMSAPTINRRLTVFGIPKKGASHFNSGKTSPKRGTILKENEVDKDLLYKSYFSDAKSKREICLEFSIAFKTLNKLFEKWGWDSRTHAEQTSNHNKNYKRGKNYGKQNKNYHYIYTKVAFESHTNECMVCGYKKFKSILEVHHRDGDRSHNEPDNLMILCPNCHKLIHLDIINADKY